MPSELRSDLTGSEACPTIAETDRARSCPFVRAKNTNLPAIAAATSASAAMKNAAEYPNSCATQPAAKELNPTKRS